MFSHDDSENEAEQEDTDDFQWRKDRYEREKFIKEETVNIVLQIDVKLHVCFFWNIYMCRWNKYYIFVFIDNPLNRSPSIPKCPLLNMAWGSRVKTSIYISHSREKNSIYISHSRVKTSIYISQSRVKTSIYISHSRVKTSIYISHSRVKTSIYISHSRVKTSIYISHSRVKTSIYISHSRVKLVFIYHTVG